MSEHTAVQDQLDRVEAKLDYLLDRLARAEAVGAQLAPIVMEHPMLKPLLRSMGL